MKLMTKKHKSNSNSSIKERITQEYLRQASLSFNLALTKTAISFFISIILGGLILLDKVPSDTIIPIVRFILSMECLNSAKDANDCLSKILLEEYNENVEEDNEN